MAVRIEQNAIVSTQSATVSDILPGNVKHVRPIHASETTVRFSIPVDPDQPLIQVYRKLVQEMGAPDFIGFEPCTSDGAQPLQPNGDNPRVFVGMGFADQVTDANGQTVLQVARREPWDRQMHTVRRGIDFVLLIPNVQYTEGSDLRHAA